jgi:uncharacterized protein
VNAKGIIGRNPLHCAIVKGHIEVVRLLCDRGADIEACNENGRRPLHYAVCYGHISIVKELIEVRNAEINARNYNGKTALSIARYRNYAVIAANLVSHVAIK